MTQTKAASGAGSEPLTSFATPTTSSPRKSLEDHTQNPRTPSYMPFRLPSASIQRLIARIEVGTATPEDIADLPSSLVQYLDAVVTLCDSGFMD